MTDKLLDPAAIVAALPRPAEGGGFLVALSGGLDSTTLLYLLSSADLPAPLRAMHVHHGLQPDADQWLQICRSLCARLDVTFDAVRVNVEQGARRSLEAEARTARYSALQAAMQPGDVLLTAHHLDDQAETLLLQLLRGSGVRGLAAMPPCADFGPGRHARPLLDVPRHRIETYAHLHGLTWVEDPSNADHRFARSRLRQQVMPLVRAGWPEAPEMLGRAARHCAEAAEILDEVALQDLARCSGSHAESLFIPTLRELTPVRCRNALRVWFEQRGLPLPSAAHLLQIETEVLDAAVDAMPLLSWPGVEVRRHRDQLFAIQPLPAIPEPADWEWLPNTGSTVDLLLPPGCGKLEAAPGKGAGLRYPHAGEEVRVRLSQGGERVQLPGRDHHHELKHLLQQAGIPPWVRRRLPLVYYGNEIAAVADLWVSSGYQPVAGEGSLTLRWREPPPGHLPLKITA